MLEVDVSVTEQGHGVHTVATNLSPCISTTGEACGLVKGINEADTHGDWLVVVGFDSVVKEEFKDCDIAIVFDDTFGFDSFTLEAKENGIYGLFVLDDAIHLGGGTDGLVGMVVDYTVKGCGIV